MRPSQALPRIAPDAIARPALGRWLSSHERSAVRLIAAPPGTGKRTGTVRWLKDRRGRSAYLAVPRDCSAALVRALTDELGADGEPLTVLVDHVDQASRPARRVLEALPLEIPENVSLIYLTRSRVALELDPATAATIDAEALRFDVDDVRRLCDAHALPATSADCAALVRATEGWAMLVAGAIRTAADAGVPVSDGLARWRRSDGHVVASLIDDALEAALPEDATLLRRVLSGDEAPTDATVARLADAGLFAEVSGGRPRLNVAVLAFPTGPRAALLSHDDVLPATLEMFGPFSVRIAGQAVRFARRRDRNIVAFLALRPDGKATRAELLEMFWPSGDRGLARQGLRTSISMIRRAFAACVGEERVQRYFSADAAAVVFNPAVTTNALQRFHQHAARARSAQETGDAQLAFTEWSAALRLAAEPLLADEETAAWRAPYAAAVERVVAEARARLGSGGSAPAA